MQENCRLSYIGLLQLFLCTAKHNVGDTEAENLVGLFKIFPCSVFCSYRFFPIPGNCAPWPGKTYACFMKFEFSVQNKFKRANRTKDKSGNRPFACSFPYQF